MGKSVFAGNAAQFKMRIVRNNLPVSFNTAPKWNVINSEDEIILNGVTTATLKPGEWQADITIPVEYVAPDNNPAEELTLEFYGTDVNGIVRSSETELTLVGGDDDYVSEGLIYYANEPVTDRIVTSSPVESVSVRIENAVGHIIVASIDANSSTSRLVRNKSDVPDRFTSGSVYNSYITDVTIDPIDLPESTAPYLVIYTVTFSGSNATERIAHQMYWTNNRIVNMVMQMRNYLDKARLTEIDPTLQWWDNELLQSTIEGLNYINGHAPIMTYWRPSDLPQGMHTYWYYASLVHALNMRYLAEGMTNFEFTGLNTTVNVDRREALAYKIDELRAYLDRLELVKKSAASSAGIGTPDVTATTATGRASIAVLGLRINPTNNSRGLFGRARGQFRRMY